MEQRAITQMEKSKKMEKADEKFRQQTAVYEKACKEEKERVRKIQDRHKYMMGGCVMKYFPEGFNVYEFTEQEMNRIIACAFSFSSVVSMIKTVIKERPTEDQKTENADAENETAENEESDEEEDEENEGGEA